MRTIKELLILLREKLPKYIIKERSGSICWTLSEMYEVDINHAEFRLLEEYIDDHMPDDAGDFCGYDEDVSGFWWPYGELAPRLEFLDKLIKEIDEN